MNIDQLDVSDRIKRALKTDDFARQGVRIETVEQLCAFSAAEIDRTKDLGRTGQKQLLRAVIAAGYPGFGVIVKPRVRVPMGRAVV